MIGMGHVVFYKRVKTISHSDHFVLDRILAVGNGGSDHLSKYLEETNACREC